MKRFFVMFLLLGILLTTDFSVASAYNYYDDDMGSATVPDCKMYGTPGCPRDLNPVCGTDSVTYANECILCEKNRDQGQDIQIKWRGSC
ncbi:serine protease inhibitor Kazal-type 2 [Macrotis lagotis]|uniref:serine protease inhibitor Kazal-type 2 n=1 Tax=Macrotis lagotis TaxID=92651 RepID=UPI003D69851C